MEPKTITLVGGPRDGETFESTATAGRWGFYYPDSDSAIGEYNYPGTSGPDTMTWTGYEDS